MIEVLSVQFPLKESCLALSVSQRSFYKWAGREQSIQAEANAEFSKEIRRVSNEYKGLINK